MYVIIEVIKWYYSRVSILTLEEQVLLLISILDIAHLPQIKQESYQASSFSS